MAGFDLIVDLNDEVIILFKLHLKVKEMDFESLPDFNLRMIRNELGILIWIWIQGHELFD